MASLCNYARCDKRRVESASFGTLILTQSLFRGDNTIVRISAAIQAVLSV